MSNSLRRAIAEGGFHLHDAPVPDVVEALPEGLGNGVVFQPMHHLENLGLLLFRERSDLFENCFCVHGVSQLGPAILQGCRRASGPL